MAKFKYFLYKHTDFKYYEAFAIPNKYENDSCVTVCVFFKNGKIALYSYTTGQLERAQKIVPTHFLSKKEGISLIENLENAAVTYEYCADGHQKGIIAESEDSCIFVTTKNYNKDTKKVIFTRTLSKNDIKRLYNTINVCGHDGEFNGYDGFVHIVLEKTSYPVKGNMEKIKDILFE